MPTEPLQTPSNKMDEDGSKPGGSLLQQKFSPRKQTMGRTLSLSNLLKPQHITYNQSGARQASVDKQEMTNDGSMMNGTSMQPSLKVVKLRQSSRKSNKSKDGGEVGYQPKFANTSNNSGKKENKSFRLNQPFPSQMLPPTVPSHFQTISNIGTTSSNLLPPQPMLNTSFTGNNNAMRTSKDSLSGPMFHS